MTDPTPEEIRKHMASLTPEQQAQEVVEWLKEHVTKFEALGVTPDAMTTALQAHLADRARSAHDIVSSGQWFANVGGLLLAMHAHDAPDGNIPTHHIYAELMKFAVGRYLAEGYERTLLRDLLISFVNELGQP